MRSVQPLLGPRRPASRISMTSPLYAAAHPHPAGFREITIQELLPHAVTHRLVDVREPEEFVGGLGHIHQPVGHRSEEHTSELQSREKLVCRLLLEKKKKKRAPACWMN